MNFNTTTIVQPRYRRDPRRGAYTKRFELSEKQKARLFHGFTFLDQLDACVDDSARRLLLGISTKQNKREPDL